MIARGNMPFEWAASVLLREIEAGTYGSVSFTFQNGLIVAAKVEKSEKPPSAEKKQDIAFRSKTV